MMRLAWSGLFAVLCGVSLLVGAREIDVWTFSGDAWLTLTASRLPRLAALILTGVGLAVCGVILQHILRNKFVEPGTTGGLDAAKLGILVSLVLMPAASPMTRMLFALVCCFAASLGFLAIIRRIRFQNTLLVPVIGLMYGGVLSAIAEFFAYRHNILQSMQGWLLGDFSKVVQGNYEIIYLILPIVTQPSQRTHDVHGMLDIEVVERLIQQQALGLLGDGHGQERHLALPATEFLKVGVAQRLQFQERQGFVDNALVLCRERATAIGEAPEGDQFLDGEPQVEIRRLAQGGHALGVVTNGDVTHPATVEQDVATAGLHQPRDHHQQRGFARAIGADQRRQPLRGKASAHAGQHGLGAVRLAEVLHSDHGVPRVRSISARKYAPHSRFTRMPTVVL